MSRATTVLRVLGAALLAGALTIAVPACGDDDAEEAATTTTEATTTTTEATTTTTEATTTTTEATVLADFEGSWRATSYEVTSDDDPPIVVELIAAGATFTIDTGPDGRLTGQVGVPEALGGPITLDFAATFELVDQETMTVVFDPEIPPLLTDYTGPFSLEGDDMLLQVPDTTFDFGDGRGEVPATAEVALVRG